MDMFEMFNEKEKKDEVVVYFDLETQRSADEVGWDNIDLMYMSVGVAYIEPENEYRIYTEDKVNDLLDLLFSADRVVTYNGKRFDNVVLSHYSNRDVQEIPMVDMYLDIKDALKRKRGPKLDSVAQATLDGVGKNAIATEVFEWFKNGEIDKISHYCKNDVKITKDVYKYGESHGKVFAFNRNGKKISIDINWTLRKGQEDV
jgi:DEAD/DEAH box helicase domain-containing protein